MHNHHQPSSCRLWNGPLCWPEHQQQQNMNEKIVTWPKATHVMNLPCLASDQSVTTCLAALNSTPWH